eukprot:g2441.t1
MFLARHFSKSARSASSKKPTSNLQAAFQKIVKENGEDPNLTKPEVAAVDSVAMDQPASAEVEAPVLAEAPTLPNPVDLSNSSTMPASHATPLPGATQDPLLSSLQPHISAFTPKIVVVGCGGGGGNAVNNMIARNLEGVEFLVCNTDAQHLATTLTDNRVQLGAEVTGGLGCGANPDMGAAAAHESIDEIMDKIGDANMVFITAGMGGGTGTGAAHVISQAAMDSGMLTVAVVTLPFGFEGRHRQKLAQEGISLLKGAADTTIVVPNQNLFRMATEQTSLMDAFRIADDVLLAGVKSITDLMVQPGLINLDFADVETIMQGMGNAMMGTGEAEGEGRALKAAEDALKNPLLGDLGVQTAKGMLVNITGGSDMTLFEVDAAAQRVTQEVSDVEANIIFGSTYENNMEGKMRVCVVATGIDDN